MVAALSLYVVVIAYGYYFHRWGIERHHLESAWMWLIALALIFALSKRDAARGSTSSPRAFTTETRSAYDRRSETNARPELVEGRARREQVATTLAFVIAALLLYSPALRIGFLSDDFVLARLSAENEFLGRSWQFLRPLPLLCFKVVGAHPLALHIAVVVLHGINAALVTAFATALGQRAGTAVAAGALFLTFPAHVEAVAWCAGIQDVLMTTGVLATIVLANASRERVALSSLVAALLSKETAVATPALFWLSSPRRWRLAIVGLAIVALYSAARLVAVPPTPGYASLPSSYTVKELVVRPFAALTVPISTTLVSGWPWLGTMLVCALVLLLLRAAWLWRGRRDQIWTAAALGLSVLVGVAPVYSLFDVSPALQGARYLYLPAAAWSILVVVLLMASRSRLNVAFVAIVVAASVVGVRTNLRPWSAAGRVRDDLLAGVARARQAGCTAVWVSEIPDSLEGAYVFRNGLAEAVAPVVLNASAPRPCWVAGR